MYRITQSLVVGVGAGYMLVAQIDAFNRGVVIPMTTGTFDIGLILPWIIGVGFLFIFIPRGLSIYRAVSILTLTVGIGVVLPYGPAIFWTSTVEYAQNAFNFLTDGFTAATLGNLAVAIAYGLGLSYFFFTETTNRPTAPFRKAGRVVLLVYTAMCIVMTALGKINLVQWKVLDTLSGVPATWWIPAIMFVVMFIDNFYPLKNLVKRPQEVEV